MKQARDYRKYNVLLTSADWQRGSGRVISHSMCVPVHACKRVRNVYKCVRLYMRVNVYVMYISVCACTCV